MRRLPIREEIEPVLIRVKSRAVLLITTHLREERGKKGKVEKGVVHLVHIHVRKTGRGVEVKIHSLRAGERRFLTTVIIIFEEITGVGNDKGRVH